MSNDFSIDIDRYGRLHLDDPIAAITPDAVGIRVHQTPGEAVVTVSGRVSGPAAEAVRDVVQWLSDTCERPLFLDLSHATVDDLYGLVRAA